MTTTRATVTTAKTAEVVPVVPLLAFQVSPQLELLPRTDAPHAGTVSVFLAHCETDSTRRTYRAALDLVARFIRPTATALDIPWDELRAEHAGAIRAHLAKHLRSPRTTNKAISALRGVVKQSWKLERMGTDTYMRALEALRTVRGETLEKGRALSTGELAALVESCRDPKRPFTGARDVTIIGLQAAAGLRRSEVGALKLSDYDASTGELRVHNSKGRKSRRVYVSNGLKDAIDFYLELRGDTPGPLVVPFTPGGEPLMRRCSSQVVWRVTQRRGELAKLKHFSPHDLRRTYISNLLDATGDLSAVQQLAGHAHVSTTLRYDKRGERAKKKAAESVHFPFSARGFVLRT